MPWCEDCAKYYAPSAMNTDGTCPSCGRVVEAPLATSKNLNLRRLAESAEDDADARAPWHFKLLIALLAVYLTWRIVDLLL